MTVQTKYGTTQQRDRQGNVIVNIANDVEGSAANTARTAATKVLPVQILGADGSVPAMETAGADAGSNTNNAMSVKARLVGFNGATWDRIRTAVVSITSTLTGFLNTIPYVIYHASPTTRTEGQGGPMEGDVNGNTKTTLATAIAGEDLTNDVLKTEVRGSYKYQAAAAADVVVKASAGFLYGIIVGADVGSAVIEVSDHASDGDGNVQIYLAGNTLLTSTGGYVPVNAAFAAGICADLTNQTNVTFIYR